MKIYDDIEVAAATHTGRVRTSNEDDYLILMPSDWSFVEQRGRVVALADGMGGVTGGAEASRSATRAVSQSFLQTSPDAADAKQRMRLGFELACSRVYELSHQSPSLRGMGTTLTVLNLLEGRAVLGHVGDSRCYRLRGGELEQLTEDHAVSGQENRLTRCVGGGRREERADVTEFEVRQGDCFLLATDGLWDLVAAEDIRRAMGGADVQAAAEGLVELANRNGGSDNSTAVMLRVQAPSASGRALREVSLPAEEPRPTGAALGPGRRLRAPRWPWVIVFVSLVLGTLAVARLWGVDIVDWILNQW